MLEKQQQENLKFSMNSDKEEAQKQILKFSLKNFKFSEDSDEVLEKQQQENIKFSMNSDKEAQK